MKQNEAIIEREELALEAAKEALFIAEDEMRVPSTASSSSFLPEQLVTPFLSLLRGVITIGSLPIRWLVQSFNNSDTERKSAENSYQRRKESRVSLRQILTILLIICIVAIFLARIRMRRR
jgi:hypothetical protein